jgi:hypothetical protein
MSPSLSTFSPLMPIPFTLVPLVEPRSTTTKLRPDGRISAWRRLTLPSLTTTVHSGWRPNETTWVVSGNRSPEGSTSAAADCPCAGSFIWEEMPKRPALRSSSTRSTTVTGPMKW